MTSPNARPEHVKAESRSRLIRLIEERSLLRDTDVTLASGATSTFYFDMKRTAFHPEGANLIAGLLLDELSDIEVDYVGGLEMGAVPLVACVIQSSFPDRPLGGFFVRKQPKEHGTRRLIEGLLQDESLSGKSVVLLEDVTTTGGSVLKAVAAIREDGGIVPRVVTVVDRLDGAAANLASDNIELAAVLTAHDFAV